MNCRRCNGPIGRDGLCDCPGFPPRRYDSPAQSAFQAGVVEAFARVRRALLDRKP